MLIICPSCATSYEVQPTTLPPHGGQVRCLRCRTVWYARFDQANRLLAAAAAIAADCGIRWEPNSRQEGTKAPGPSGDVAAAASRSELATTAEMGTANAAADSLVVAEGAAIEPEPDRSLMVAGDVAADPEPGRLLGVVEGAAQGPQSGSCAVAGIVVVNLEPDPSPVVGEDATADSQPAPSIVGEVLARESQSDHAVTCETFAGPDVNVASMALVPPNEPLHRSVSETPESDQVLGLVTNGTLLPDNLFAEVAGDERSTGQAVDAFENEPPANSGCSVATSDEAGDAASLSGVEDCPDDVNASDLHEAAQSQTALDADQRPIDLKAAYSETRLSEKIADMRRRTASRSHRKAKVPSRGGNVAMRNLIPRWPLSNLHTGIIALALLDVVVGWRTDIVRKLPQTASFYALAGLPVNLRGLAFDGITTSTARDDGTPILVVEGNIINDTRKNVRVPQIRFVVRDAAAQEIYSWTASAARTSLPPGQAVTFRTRLASPPPGAHDVVLRFVSRRDALAVIR